MYDACLQLVQFWFSLQKQMVNGSFVLDKSWSKDVCYQNLFLLCVPSLFILYLNDLNAGSRLSTMPALISFILQVAWFNLTCGFCVCYHCFFTLKSLTLVLTEWTNHVRKQFVFYFIYRIFLLTSINEVSGILPSYSRQDFNECSKVKIFCLYCELCVCLFVSFLFILFFNLHGFVFFISKVFSCLMSKKLKLTLCKFAFSD